MPGKSRMKNLIIVTGGAGFVGSNLIELLLNKTRYKIINIKITKAVPKKTNFVKLFQVFLWSWLSI